MRPHDELLHYGVKGMRWGKKKDPSEIDMKKIKSMSEAQIMGLDASKLQVDVDVAMGVSRMQKEIKKRAKAEKRPYKTSGNHKGKEDKKVGGLSGLVADKTKANREDDKRIYKEDGRGRKNLKNQNSYQNPPGLKVNRGGPKKLQVKSREEATRESLKRIRSQRLTPAAKKTGVSAFNRFIGSLYNRVSN